MNMPDFNATNLVETLVYMNSLTSDWFGTLIPLAFFIVMFMALQKVEIEKALLASSFISFLFTVWWFYAGISPDGMVILFAIATAIGAILNMY